MKKYAPLLLRSALAIVFLWFGFSQIHNPTQWTGMLPEYVSLIPLTPVTLIYIHGIFEISCATLILLGLYVRIAALLLALNLFNIIFIVGYGPIGARDFALGLATLSIVLNGPDEFCLDVINKKQQK